MKKARPGFSLIELLVVLAIIAVLVGLLLPAVMRVRESAAQTGCKNNLRQIGLALHGYENANGHLPPCKLTTPTRHGWAPFILPYIEQNALFQQYRWDRNWSSTENAPVRLTPLKLMQCPSAPPNRFDLTGAGNPRAAAGDYAPIDGIQPPLRSRLGYAAGADMSGVLRADIYTRLTDVVDGTSSTIMIAEDAGRPDVYRAGKLDPNIKASGAGWADEEAEFDIHGYSFDGLTVYGDCAINCYSSNEIYAFHPSGAHLLFADGSVRFVLQSVEIRIIVALATRAGNEILSADGY